MGGYGSGRNTGRATTGTALPLTVRAVLTYGGTVRWSRGREPVASVGFGLSPPGPLERSVVLRWTQSGGQSFTQTLRLVAAPMRFGGARWWWACSSCGARRATLYNPSGGRGWACRTCYRLAYPVQNESTTDRAFRRWQRVAAQLSVRDLVPADAFDMDSADWTPDRPRGMRRRTYARLTAQWESALYQTATGLGRQWSQLVNRMDSSSSRKRP